MRYNVNKAAITRVQVEGTKTKTNHMKRIRKGSSIPNLLTNTGILDAKVKLNTEFNGYEIIVYSNTIKEKKI